VQLNEESRRNSSRFFAVRASSNASTAADALLRLASVQLPAGKNALDRPAAAAACPTVCSRMHQVELVRSCSNWMRSND